MAETAPASPVDLLPTEFELPALSELSDMQQTELAEGPGWVSDPVEVLGFADLESFKPDFKEVRTADQNGSNNFHGLIRAKGVYKYVADNTAAVQRFKIVFPGVVEALADDMEGLSNSEITDRTWNDLLRTYNIMSKMIDFGDDRVTGDPEVDKFYLTS